MTIIGLELDIQGLQKYTDYQISVCGVNTVGDGPYSVPVIISTDMDGMYFAWIKFLNTDIEPFMFSYNSKKKFQVLTLRVGKKSGQNVHFSGAN